MRKLTIPELIIESTHIITEIKGIYAMYMFSSPKADNSVIDVYFINKRGYKYKITYYFEKRDNQIIKEIESLDDIEDECYYCDTDFNQKDLKEILDRWNL